ncbi:TadE/TadG family type IV pilus assembly protein [Pseudooctadecabacter jejudonensis]|uniref:TadE-like protein n=1 Tax=Pseudooctadecabacter jejudonensis TaxID=1391910 RepID=A0A1Y5SHE9_9RHOB|nr:TadE/TadG family type IV pilus assembly protein [Pseudooctadecabacter jejudonensis]SLN40180.1 hypothetical protein PSJ8397_01992 [Pseudooctadecabacter jejudonensis]
MHFLLRTIGAILRRFRRNESGGPTVEFVLLFTPFIVLPVTGFEMGLLMTRHAMLERGLDMAIREVRLNTGEEISETDMKRMICNAAGILPECMTNVRLEMRTLNMRHVGNQSTNSIPRSASCTNLNQPFLPARNFENGAANQMMIVRACGVFKPMLIPGVGVAYQLNQGPQGRYRLVATSAFVMEPL